MIGPEGVNVPAQTQALGSLGKQAQDLIGADYKLTVSGTSVRASGEVKNITQPWTAYAAKDNTGHFAPTVMPAACVDQEVTVGGRKDGEKTVTIDEDRLLVVRIENLQGGEMPVKMGGKPLMTVDFSGTFPKGRDAIDWDKKDFGSYGKFEDYLEGVEVFWSGNKGTVKGTIKNHGAINGGKVKAGHHYPLALSAYYFDGVPKTVTVGDGKPKTVTDKDIICDVSKAQAIKVEYNGVTVLELDLSQATIE